jgi:hypothetical protein
VTPHRLRKPLDANRATLPAAHLRLRVTVGVIVGTFPEGTFALPMPENPSHVTRNTRW